MYDQTSPRDVVAELDQLECIGLHLRLDAETTGVWSEREVAQAIGSDAHAALALVSLHTWGLILRLEEFVFPTRAAARFSQLQEGA
jgi:hypothetical protein